MHGELASCYRALHMPHIRLPTCHQGLLHDVFPAYLLRLPDLSRVHQIMQAEQAGWEDIRV